MREKTGQAAHVALCRPNGMAIGKKNRTLLMLEFTRGSDYDDDFVARIESAKTARYARSLDVMRRLLPGWQVEVVCFTVGVRGSVPRASLEPSLRRLGVEPAPAHKIMAAVAAATFSAMFTIWDTRTARLAMIRPPLPGRVVGRGSQGRPPVVSQFGTSIGELGVEYHTQLLVACELPARRGGRLLNLSHDWGGCCPQGQPFLVFIVPHKSSI